MTFECELSSPASRFPELALSRLSSDLVVEVFSYGFYDSSSSELCVQRRIAAASEGLTVPSDEANQRRLAVILAADVAGYSRLMSEDEDAALNTLATYQEVIAGLVGEHHGRIFGIAGDSVMVEFASAVQAVRCAVAIQRAFSRRNADLPEHRQMLFRIGINLGDVIARERDLYGDGVNIAARLQTLSQPGCICISASVYEQIVGKLSFACQFLGEQIVKNIARPVNVYSLDPRPEAPIPCSARK